MNVCVECGHASAKWFGRCPDCGAWSSASEAEPTSGGALTFAPLGRPLSSEERFSSGISEVDRVLGGGFVLGETVLLAGEPGIGKSTLVLQILDRLARAERRAVLVSGEESTGQIALRGERLGVDPGGILVAAATSVGSIVDAIEKSQPDVLVVDSVQTLRDDSFEQGAGSVVQVRECAAALVTLAKANGTVVVLVGHVTKDGSVAGPKTLEHMVDAVLSLEGERSGVLRTLRANKNRFGSCEETGVFVMNESGLEVVGDPSALLLADRQAGVPGSAVTCALEGTRPILVEIQALVSHADQDQPRRVAIGLDGRRLALLLGILQERSGRTFGKHHVYLAAAGGLTMREPATDAASCLALASALDSKPLPSNVVAIGEVGLAGEIRRVPGAERRLAEAARLGFEVAFVPPGIRHRSTGMQVIETGHLRDLFGGVEALRAHV